MSLIGNPDTPLSYVADYMQACVGMFGIPAGGFTGDIEAYGAATGYNVESLYAAMLNSSVGRAIYAPGISNESFATKLVDKLGGSLLSDANKAAAIDEVQALLDGGMSHAATTMAAVEFVAGVSTDDEVYGAIAQQFANRIEIANYYTFSSTTPSSALSTLTGILAGVTNETDVSDPEAYLDTIDDPNVSSGQTYVLTNSQNPNTGGVDNVTGTNKGDTILGVLDIAAGTSNSFDAGDVINGGDGVDTLSLTLIESSATGSTSVSSGVVTGVEVLSLSNSALAGTTVTFDATNVSGLTTVVQKSSLDNRGLEVSGLASIVDAEMAGQGSLELTYDATAVGGTSDVQNLKLNGTKEGTSATNIFTADGVETIAVTTAVESEIQIAGDAVKTITAAGAGKLTLSSSEATLKTIDASAATGDTKVVVGSTATAVTSVKTGAGNDTVRLDVDITKNISVDGGAGTNTLEVTNASFADDAFTNVTNIDTIALASDAAAVSIDVGTVTGLDSVVAALQTTGSNKSGTLDVENLANNATVTLSSKNLAAANSTAPATFDLDGQDDVTLTIKGAVTGETDELNIKVVNDNVSKVKNTDPCLSSNNTYVIDSVVAANIETVNVDSSGSFGSNKITLIDADKATALTFTGATALSVGGIDAATGENVTLDASAMTGKFSLSLTAAQAAQFETGVIGGSGTSDSISITAIGDSDDVLLTSTKFESVSATFSADSSGSFSFNGFSGATSKSVTFTTNSAGSDTASISGFASTDTLNISGSLGTDAATIQGAGSTSALTVNFKSLVDGGGVFDGADGVTGGYDDSDDNDFAAGGFTFDRVGTLTIDTTRPDACSGASQTQADTDLGSVTSTTLSSIAVTGKGTLIDLGTIVADKLATLDFSAFKGAVAFDFDNDGDAATVAKALSIKLNAETDAGSITGSGTSVTAASGGITLADNTDADANRVETIVFASNIKGDMVISGFTGGVGASVGTKVDKLDFSALGISLADLVFTDVNLDTFGADTNDDSVVITSDAFTGRIVLVGTNTATVTSAGELNSTNFVF